MLKRQQELLLSPYMDLYDILIPKDHELRKINELVDFEFIYDELKDKYCHNDGREAIDPVRLFKYLLLKAMHPLSDRDLVERVKTDLAFKFFLEMAPEEDVIDPSLLSKFRRQRLVDVDLLDKLITKTVEIAMEQGVLKSKTIMIDATHTASRFNKKKPTEILRTYSKAVRKEVYRMDESIKELLPEKTKTDDLEQEKEYTQKLIDVVENQPISQLPNISQKVNLLKEKLEDIQNKIVESFDEEARTGHKSQEDSFLGFKTHVAMTDERIITAAVVTSGEKGDGPQFQTLIEKTTQNGVDVEEGIADAAYSSQENMEFSEKNGITLYSKLNSSVSHGKRKDAWDFNKDADSIVCPAGHLPKSKYIKKKQKKENAALVYCFDIKKCKECPFRKTCYKEGAKTRTYQVAILTPEQEKQKAFEQTKAFKEKAKERYMIEAKNAEMKTRHGYEETIGTGLFGMTLQAATTIFAVNMKRIIKLMDEK